MEQAPGKADEGIQAEPHQATQPPVRGDVVGDRRRPGVIEFDKALAEAVRQEDAVAELAQQLYLRLELGTEGRGGDEAAAPAAATAAAARVGQHPVEAVGDDAGAFIVGMEAVGGERGPVGRQGAVRVDHGHAHARAQVEDGLVVAGDVGVDAGVAGVGRQGGEDRRGLVEAHRVDRLGQVELDRGEGHAKDGIVGPFEDEHVLRLDLEHVPVQPGQAAGGHLAVDALVDHRGLAADHGLQLRRVRNGVAVAGGDGVAHAHDHISGGGRAAQRQEQTGAENGQQESFHIRTMR